jgi:hypothetical protein
MQRYFDDVLFMLISMQCVCVCIYNIIIYYSYPRHPATLILHLGAMFELAFTCIVV